MEWVYEEIQDGVWVRRDRKESLSEIDTVVFDVDGVLVHVKDSFPEVSADAAVFYLQHILGWSGTAQPVTPTETVSLKQAGGFNSDWRVTRAIVYFALYKSVKHGTNDLDRLRTLEPDIATFMRRAAEAGGGMPGVRHVVRSDVTQDALQQIEEQFDPDKINQLSCEFYAGSDAPTIYGFQPEYRAQERGYIWRETPLLERGSLLDSPFRLGIYTGRTDGEMPPALQLCRVEDLFDKKAMITGSSAFHKPDPGGLVEVAAILGTRHGIFVGDNVDDLTTVTRYRETGSAEQVPFSFSGILGGALGSESLSIFQSLGADCIAEDVNRLLGYLREIHRPQ